MGHGLSDQSNSTAHLPERYGTRLYAHKLDPETVHTRLTLSYVERFMRALIRWNAVIEAFLGGWVTWFASAAFSSSSNNV